MKTLLLAFSIFLLSSVAFGQQELIKSIGNNAKEKANATDFNTTRNNKERGNLMDDKKSRQASPTPAAAPPAPVMESETPAPSEPSGEYQASYTFTSSASYKMESSHKPGESQTMRYYFGDQVIQVEAIADMSSIIDSKNGVMITLNNKDKSATVISTKTMEAVMKQQQANQGEKTAAKVTKTGKTKTILGYTCEEFLIETDKKSEVWISSETGVDANNAFANLSKTPGAQIPAEALTNGGLLMEMTAYDATGKVEMKMIVTALSKESKTVNIGAYKITKL
ncbi:hypothetical protein D3C87_38250 [compost metagenome]